MQTLTEYGKQTINNIASRYNLSSDTVLTMLHAVRNGNGTMAQFNCPELGGQGQWMQGGMTMVGDMFNYNLQSTVSNLCAELSDLIYNQGDSLFLRPVNTDVNNQNWWSQCGDLGIAASSGSQNAIRYAIFPATARLAIENQGEVTIYNTLDHQITGISQQQGGGSSVSFTSQYGLVYLNQLPIISTENVIQQNSAPMTQVIIEDSSSQQPENTIENIPSQDILDTIERLALLKDQGILSDEEFTKKKSELLTRL